MLLKKTQTIVVKFSREEWCVLAISKVEYLSRTRLIGYISVCPWHILPLDSFLRFWRVAICGILVGTLDLGCPERAQY